MKEFIAVMAAFISIQAFAVEPILPGDLEENEPFLVKKIEVSWDTPLAEVRFPRGCDEFIWDRVLVHLPANIPFETTFHEFINYEDELLRPAPGDQVMRYSIWKEDESNGFKRLLFKDLSRIFIIFKTKMKPVKEFRVAIYGSC